jgi:hypothetical protein
MKYRFKTEEEFLEEYGKDWRYKVYATWISPDMDEWLGKEVPFHVDPSHSFQGQVGRDLWCTSIDMMTDKPLRKTVPNYEPRKIERTLESTMYKYYNEITKQYTRWPYRFKIKEEFDKSCRITSSINEWSCGEYLFVSPMTYLFGKTLEYEFEDDEPFINIPRFNDEGTWYVTREMLIKNSLAMPSYKPKKINRTLESLENHLPIYVVCDNKKKYTEFEDFLHKNGWVWAGGDTYILSKGNYTAITFDQFDKERKIFNGWNKDKTYDSVLKEYKKYIYPEDFQMIKKELGIPSYEPRKTDRNMDILKENKQNLQSEDLLLEKSSLTKLGVPREVMQPLQKDFAIPADAQWERVGLKRDVEKIFRDGEKELILQIEVDSIKVFVSYFTPSADRYFIDSYVLDESGWGGYEKIPREEVTLTRLLYEINSKSLLYHLKSPFSLIRQPKRLLMKKEKGFQDFTEKFKKDFLENFDLILKRIVGSQYKDAKQEIKDKARQVEIENKMMLSGLDDPLEGPNSLTILDQFLTEFEDAYSDFFGERLDIQELSQYFSREKMMTSFMYYIYTGKLLNK